MVNPYLDLTAAFNRGRLRALISSGQAVVLHRLAIMSKDGDWVLREDDEATGHVLAVLAARGARYYADAAAPWRALWPEVAREIADRPLPEAHRVVSARAEGVLPFELETGDSA